MNDGLKKGFLIRVELMGIISAIVIQTLAAVWWASGVSTTLNYTRNEIVSLKEEISTQVNDRYRGADAKRDFAIRDSVISMIEGKITNLEKSLAERGERLAALETKVKK